MDAIILGLSDLHKILMKDSPEFMTPVRIHMTFPCFLASFLKALGGSSGSAKYSWGKLPTIGQSNGPVVLNRFNQACGPGNVIGRTE